MSKPILTNFTTFSGSADFAYFALSLDIAMPKDKGFSSKAVETWIEYFPEKAIVKCKHCGQYGARYTACVHCGAPID